MRRTWTAGAMACLLVTALVGCTETQEPSRSSGAPEQASNIDTATAPTMQTAERLLQVTTPHEATGGTLLEGPVIGPEGALYIVDVMAPPGEPKVLRIDLDTQETEPVYTDDTRAFTSAQFSPTDGRLYLTDIVSGSILSITADGQDPQTLFTGEVDGTAMLPDDITFDPDGNAYVSDTRGMDGPGWETPGRVVRVSTDGEATVLADQLPSPNGIVFDEDDTGLYVAQYNANRIDHLILNESRTSVTASYPAIHVNAGRSRVDSTAVDADGNLYQAFHGRPEIEVYSPAGKHLSTISVPADEEGLESATNIAITPGTTDGYMTVSGPAGGMIYTFDALSESIRQSNGG